MSDMQAPGGVLVRPAPPDFPIVCSFQFCTAPAMWGIRDEDDDAWVYACNEHRSVMIERAVEDE